MPERWRSIRGLAGYEVSNLGRVRTWKRRGIIPPDRILRVAIDRDGYEQVTLSVGANKTFKVHTLVALAFLGPRPTSVAGEEIRHLDGDKRNNAVSNLAYGSRSDNQRDSVKHGTHRNIRKTHCPVGHPYDDANTKTYKGKRQCRACANERERLRRREVVTREVVA